MFYIDSYYLILVVPAILLALYAQVKVKGTYSKYSQISSNTGLTGADVAKRILAKNGLNHVAVLPIAGQMTDHYDPKKKTVRLSEGVYGSTTVAALSIAAHEVGHAIQDAEEYGPMRMRAAVFPLANIGSSLAMPLIFLGFILQIVGLVKVGIAFFSFAVLFQVITLPVEFDASRRALSELKDGVLTEGDYQGGKRMLQAAALTYIAATLVALMQLIRLILISRDRD